MVLKDRMVSLRPRVVRDHLARHCPAVPDERRAGFKRQATDHGPKKSAKSAKASKLITRVAHTWAARAAEVAEAAEA